MLYDSIPGMDAEFAALPEDVNTLKTALLVARADVARVSAEAATALARQSSDQALIAYLKLPIEKLNSHITQNWRGKPLVSRMAIVELIAASPRLRRWQEDQRQEAPSPSRHPRLASARHRAS